MSASMRMLVLCLCFLCQFTPLLSAQDSPQRIPADLFLPFDNERSSDPGLQRVYKQVDGKILPPERQPQGYPKKFDSSYVPKEDEAIREHRGTDYMSRDKTGKPVPLDFKGVQLLCRHGLHAATLSFNGWSVKTL